MDNIHRFTAPQEIEEQAADWLVRLDSEQPPSGEELSELKAWINRSPAHRQQFQRLAQYWHHANILTELSFPMPGSQRPEGLWPGIKQQLTHNWQAAASMSVAVILSLGLAIGIINSGVNGISGNGIYQTRIGEQNSITLVDGSVIQLNTNSQLQVDYIDNQRNVRLLSGEAHFEVAKDSKRPFIVKAGEGKVQAIGTAFSVRLKQQAIEVIVNEGKVGLSDATEQFQADMPYGQDYLIAGQGAEFKPQDDSDTALQVEQFKDDDLARQLAWRKGLMVFTGEPLEQVIEEVNRYTNLNILIIDAAIADISIGGQFNVGETEALLSVLEASFNIGIARPENNTVHLYSN